MNDVIDKVNSNEGSITDDLKLDLEETYKQVKNPTSTKYSTTENMV